ncbi:MAG TPA: DUF4397 domain-containing protein [Polyangiaceae bacterium LLY-WYZ-14_1]|nr:DUF4397 domain-containing protein [Polyangiaceae bacterium LLY-WYZ-14_1]
MTTWRLTSWLGRLAVALGLVLMPVACGDDGGDGMMAGDDDDDDMMVGDDDDDMMVGDDDDDDDDDDGVTVNVRAVHAAPDAGNVDIWVDGETEPRATDVAYLDVVGPVSVPAGAGIEVFAAGGDPASDDPVVSFNASTTPNATTTFVVRVNVDGDVVGQGLPDAQLPAPEDPLLNVAVRFVNVTAPSTFVSVDTDLDTIRDTPNLQAGATDEIEISQNANLFDVLGPPPQATRRGRFSFQELSVEAGDRSYLFIAGDAEQGRMVDEGITLIHVNLTSEVSETFRPVALPGQLRVLHLSDNAPAVDVYPLNPGEEDVPLIDDLTFGQASRYLQGVDVTAGFEVYLGDQLPTDEEVEPLFVINASRTEILTEEARHTLVVFGDASDEAEEGTELDFELFVDRSGVTDGGFLARVLHASPLAPPVRLDVDGDGMPDTDPLGFTDLAEAELPIPAQVALFSEDDARITSFTVPGSAEGGPAGNGVAYVAVLGDPALHPSEAESLSVLVSRTSGEPGVRNTDQPRFQQDPMLWVFHGVPDVANPVDVAVAPGPDEVLATGVTFGDLTSRIQLSPQDVGFEVRVDGAAVSTDTTTFTLSRGTRYLGTVLGLASPDADDPAESTIQFAVYEDGFDRTDEENVRVRAIHASPDAFPVNVGTVETVEMVDTISRIDGFGSLAFGDASGPAGVSLPPVTSPDTISLGAIDAEDEGDTPDIVFPGVTGLMAGSRLFGLVAGEQDPDLNPDTALLQAFFIETGMGPWTVVANIPARPGEGP